LVVESGG